MIQTSSKKIEILDLAQEAIQKRGYNAFSYADLAKEIGIRKASIHHYFPSKADLGLAVIRRYREFFQQDLDTIHHTEKNWLNKIACYINLYEEVLLSNRLCLCGMLATDIETLPKPLQIEIRKFFMDNINWLFSILRSHYSAKKFPDNRLTEIATMIISTLQGITTMTKALHDHAYFTGAVRELMLHLQQLK